MARYSVVSTATVVLTNPEAARLLNARTALDDAETAFYRGRRDLVNSYPMKTRDITTAEIESLYDTHLGAEPWRYRNRFSSSGSTPKGGNYGNAGGGLFSVPSHQEIYVDEWGTTPVGVYPTIENTFGAAFFLYDGERGASWVDLIVQYGYNGGFSDRGGSRYAGSFTVYRGFGELPVAYNGRGGLSDFEAHMLKLVGDAWEDVVGDAYDEYRDALDAYRTSSGSSATVGFSSTPTAQPWEGYIGTSGGYNRPEQLATDLVRETRGVN